MNLLIIDDDENVRTSIVKFLGLHGHEARGASGAAEAQTLLTSQPYDALLLDLRMPGMDGLEFLNWLRDESFIVPVIMISAHGEIRDAVQALKLGARDYLTKPFDPDELLLRVKRLDEELQLKKNLDGHGGQSAQDTCFWGSSHRVLELRDEIARAAQTDATILLQGESGTGKEVTARWIHAQSRRRDEPFIAVNLGSLSESLVESELFGHEKGAFTGAHERRSGIFEAARHGTVFLDEVGELPLPMQPKLLRVLQEGMVKRIGNPREFPIDVRIIAATNRSLEELTRVGEFREDLYYRLNIIPFTLPPLRDRIEDLPELAGILLAKIGKRIGKRGLSLDPASIETMRSYRFPGNIRELENLLERWAILSPGSEIRPRFEFLEPRDLPLDPEPGLHGTGSASAPEARYNLKEAERRTIAECLEQHGGNRTRTALALGISRKTLIAKIAEFGLR